MSLVRKFSCILLLTHLVLSMTSRAQMPIEWRVTTYDESKGLSSRKVTRLLEDHSGYLWIGTPDGLNRFDGYGFKTFRKIPGDSASIGGNYVSHLAEDSDHNIWIAFLNGGLSCYSVSKGTFTNYPSNDYQQGSLPSGEISTVFADKNNEIWVGVTQRGLYHLNPKSGQFTQRSISTFDDPYYTPQQKKIYNTVYAIYEDEAGLFWLATHDGLYTYNRQSDHFEAIRKHALKPGQLRTDLFGTVIADSTLGFWLGSWAGGISYYNRQTKQYTTYKYDSVSPSKESINIILDLKKNPRNDLWVATPDRGFGIFSSKLHTFLFFGDTDNFHANIPSKQCYRVLEDRERNIWIAHIGGLTKIEQRKRLFPFKSLGYLKAKGNDPYEVRAVVHDRDSTHIYIGSAFAEGFYVINSKSGDTARIRFPSKPTEVDALIVSDVVQDYAGRVWVLTRDYLFEYNKQSKKLEMTALTGSDSDSRSDHFGRLIPDSRNKIWITSTSNGVFCFDPDKRTAVHYAHKAGDPSSIGSDVIRIGEEDSKGKMWFGGIRGCLAVFDPASQTFTNYQPDARNKNSIASDRVWSLRSDSYGNMWVGTDMGLYQFSNNGPVPKIVKLYTAAEGLQADLATSLLPDVAGNMWAITPVGLSMINPFTQKIISFNASDGLIKEDIGIRLIPAPGNRMYMSAPVGYFTFDPATTRPPSKQPAVYINSFKIFDKERDFKKDLLNDHELTLRPNENFFSFEFVSIDFNRPEQQRYSYMLEGFDHDWIYSDARRYASYTNLPGGHYKFKVRASIGTDKWGKETVVPLFIQSPFYKTWWFITTVISLLTIAIVSWFRTRNQNIKAEKEEVEIQTAINYFASSIYEQQTVETILKDVAKNCISRLHFEDCVIFMLDEEKGLLIPKAVYGHDQANSYTVETAPVIPYGKGIVGSVAKSGKSEMIGDTSQDQRYIVGNRHRFSEITVPMVLDGKVLGIIDCEHSGKNFFTDKHMSILTTIASLCANKIVRARAQEEREQTREMLLDTQQRMAEAEMQALRAQMNPHFIFNCLNSINRYIVKSDQATASLYLTRFAKLIRLILDNSNSKNVILANELEALKLYIEMEALRFDKKFDYGITVSPEVNADSIEVPPLIIQPYVENAIWHGLLHKEIAGRLSISVSMASPSMLQCVIEDNGIGRTLAKELRSKSATTRKSLGIKLTEDRLSLVNKHTTMNASVNIVDITLPDGQAGGTKVVIKIPVM